MSTVEQEPIPHPEDLIRLAICCADFAGGEMLENWRRVTGNPSPKSALARMVDDATGKTEADAWEWIAFIKDCVWDRLPREMFTLERPNVTE